MMGGDIELISELKKGSTFRLILRNVEWLSTHSIENLNRNNQRELDSYSFNPAKLLICDDIDYNRDLLAAYLENQPFQLFFAANGKEALDIVKENKPDLIFLDMKMPVMDGYSFVKKLRSLDDFSHLPVIAVTASSFKDDEENILKLCNNLLRKPVSKGDVIFALTDYLSYTRKSINQNSEKETFESTENGTRNKVAEQFFSYLEEGDMDKICSKAIMLKKENSQYTFFADALYAAAQACDEERIVQLLKKEAL